MAQLTDQQLKEIFERTERESNRLPELIDQLNKNIERLDSLVPKLGQLILDDYRETVPQ